MLHAPVLRTDVSARYDALRQELDSHPLYTAISTTTGLQVFLEHHVFAVWDFMSLLKSLQHRFAPDDLPWVPPGNARHAKFINQLVLEEESDCELSDGTSTNGVSHFERYLQAMIEVGADIDPITRFVEHAGKQGIDDALSTCDVPPPARTFVTFTFNIIASDQVHLMVALLAHSREELVPHLFRSLLRHLPVTAHQAPTLFAYLERHVQLDAQEHGPLAIQILSELCHGSRDMYAEAIAVAEQGLAARLEFWNGIHAAMRA